MKFRLNGALLSRRQRPCAAANASIVFENNLRT
ncbi:MAG TPA: hypothetical protein [Caudoviricetes sp.]|nr:MAG TPA: hypothetical protein [Caudoviricetes sp.]